ncbi:MAG: VOC family protein [Myxococcaceae bacterium]
MQDVEAIAPTFFVADVRRAAEWYVRVLGFNVAFLLQEAGETASYCGLQRGAATLHLAQRKAPGPGVVYKGACYLRLRSGVDGYVAQIEAAGHPLTAALKNQPYGMREATVRDLDGNDIYIGQPISAGA